MRNSVSYRISILILFAFLMLVTLCSSSFAAQQSVNGSTDLISGNTAIFNAANDGPLNVAGGVNVGTGVSVVSIDTDGAVATKGIVNFAGGSTVFASIGTAATNHTLKNVNMNGGNTATVILNGDTYAGTLNFGGDSTIDVADGKSLNITTISTSNNNQGNIAFDGTSTVSGNIGSAIAALNAIQLNGAAGTTLSLNGDTYAGTLNFWSDGTMEVAAGKNFTGVITNSGILNNKGNLTFDGTSTVSGNIGSAIAALNTINANGAAGTTLSLNGDTYAGTLNFGGDSTVELANGKTFGVTTSVTATTGSTGKLVLNGVSAIDVPIGTNDAHLRELDAGADAVTTAFNSDVYVDTHGLLGASTVELSAASKLHTANLKFFANGTARIDNDINLSGIVTTANNNQGTLVFLGSSAITGAVGANGTGLKEIDVNGGAGTTVAFSEDVYATTLNIADSGAITIAAGKNLNAAVTTTVNNKGTLSFLGATIVGGDIGTTASNLEEVNFNGSTILEHDIAATETKINSGSTVTCNGSNRTVTGDLTLSNTADTVLDIGTTNLTVTGVYTQTANSKLKATIGGTSSGKITATTQNPIVSADSTLELTLDNYVSNNVEYTVINGPQGAAVGAITNITSNSPLLALSANGGDNLVITARRTNTYDTIATGNAGKAGAVLEGVGASGATGDMATVLAALDTLPSTANIAQALQTVIPVVDGSVTTGTYEALNQFVSTIISHLGNLQNAISTSMGATGISTGSDMLEDIDVWAQGFGSYLHQDERELSDGYNATIWGTIVGFDLPAVLPDLRLGLAGGFAQDFVRSKDNSGRNDVNNYQGTLYGTYVKDAYYIDGAVSFAYNTYDSSRHIAIGNIDRTAKGDYNGQQYSVYTGGGYTFGIKKFELTPLASFQYTHLRLNSYTETGADALNLKVDAQDYDAAQTGFGVKLAYPTKCKDYTFIPEIRFKWLYDWAGDNQQATSVFTGGGGSFATTGFKPAQSSYDFGTKLTLVTKQNVTLSVNYDLELKEDFYAHYGYVNVKYSF